MRSGVIGCSVVVAAAAVVVGATGCAIGGAGDPRRVSYDKRQAERVAKRCAWGRDSVPSPERVRSAFIPAGAGEVRLLLEAANVRPGEILTVAVDNRSRESISYGTTSHIEELAGRRLELPRRYVFPMIGFVVEPGGVGPCIPILVPGRAKPGDYRAVVEDVTRGDDVDGEPVTGLFRIAGAASPQPTREVGRERP